MINGEVNPSDKTAKLPAEINAYKILGNPKQSALCFPSKAELEHVNWRAVIFAVVWWVVCFYVDTIIQVETEHIENRTYPMSEESQDFTRHHFYSESFELFDLGFAIFPRAKDIIADLFAFGIVGVTILRFLLTRNRFIVLKRYVLLLGTVFLFRGLTIVSTILPQPQRSCMATARGNPFLDGLMILLLQKKTCTDMFFSGHATNMTFAALLWTQFSHVYPIIPLTKVDRVLFRGKPLMDHFGKLRRPTLTKILVWVMVAIGCCFVCATRLHYLIDVIFGIFVSVTVFTLYHHALYNACTNNSLISRFIRWFDSDSPEIEFGRNLVESYPFLYSDYKPEHRKNSMEDDESEPINPGSGEPESIV